MGGGGVKFKGGIDMGDGGRKRDGDLRGGDGDLEGGDGDLGGGDGDMGRVEKGIWEVGIFAYFAKQGEFWERVEGELALQGNLHIVVCPCFSVDCLKV